MEYRVESELLTWGTVAPRAVIDPFAFKMFFTTMPSLHPVAQSRARGTARSAMLLLAASLISPAAEPAATTRTEIASLQSFQPHYPKRCHDPAARAPGTSGLCLLASTFPKAQGEFRIRKVSAVRGQYELEQPIPTNSRLSLPPGEYEIFKTTGIDSQNPAKVSVKEGQFVHIRTITLGFRHYGASRVFKLQRFQARSGTHNGGCLAEYPAAGYRAYLPGNFVVNFPPKGATANPLCEAGGTTFNAVAGQGYRLSRRRTAEQTLPAAHVYAHPNGVSALTAVSPTMHGIVRMGWLPAWRLHRHIPNSYGIAHPALALYGPGNYTYIVPFRFRQRHKVCGVSLAQGGLAKADLLTGCRFRGGRLTAFKVERGTYFSFHNLFGLPGISAIALGDGFKVENVNFTLPWGH